MIMNAKYTRLLTMVLGLLLADMAAHYVYVTLYGYDIVLYPGAFIIIFLVWCGLRAIDRLTVVYLLLGSMVLNIIYVELNSGLDCCDMSSSDHARMLIACLLSGTLSVLIFWLVAHGPVYRAGKDEASGNLASLWRAVPGSVVILMILPIVGAVIYLLLNYTMDSMPMMLWLLPAIVFLVFLSYDLALNDTPSDYILPSPEPLSIGGCALFDFSTCYFNTLLTSGSVSIAGEYEIIPEKPLVAIPGARLFIIVSSNYDEFIASEYKVSAASGQVFQLAEAEDKYVHYYMGSIVPLESDISAVLYGNDTELPLRVTKRVYSAKHRRAYISLSIEGDIPDPSVFERIKIINNSDTGFRGGVLWGSKNSVEIEVEGNHAPEMILL